MSEIHHEGYTPRNQCDGPCELMNYCISAQIVAEMTKPDARSSALLEAVQTVDKLDESLLDADVAAIYEEWVSRVRDMYSDEPEKLEKAIEAVKISRADARALRFMTDVMRHESLETVRAHEALVREKHESVAAAVTLRDELDCQGPVAKEPGHTTVGDEALRACRLEDTPEFQKIRQLSDDLRNRSLLSKQ